MGWLGRCGGAGRENVGNDRAEGLWQRMWVIRPKAQRLPFGLRGTVEERKRVASVFRNLSGTGDFKSCGK